MVSLILPPVFCLFPLLIQHPRYLQFLGPGELSLVLKNKGGHGSRSLHSEKIPTSGPNVEVGGRILLALVEKPRLWNRSDLGLNPNSANHCVTSNLNLFLT